MSSASATAEQPRKKIGMVCVLFLTEFESSCFINELEQTAVVCAFQFYELICTVSHFKVF